MGCCNLANSCTACSRGRPPLTTTSLPTTLRSAASITDASADEPAPAAGGGFAAA